MKSATFFAAAVVLLAGHVAQAVTILPDFNAATFLEGDPIDNTYLPLLPGTVFTLQGMEDGEVVTEKITVTFDTKSILGVTTTVVREDAFEDDLLVETSFNWYAQDSDGNVWYFGEDSTDFLYDDEGNLIGTDAGGSWQAGQNGALPGWIMPGDPTVSSDFIYQEFAPNDDALDQFRVLGLSVPIATVLGNFNALKVLEYNPIDDEYENKYYAAGIGLVLVEEGVGPNGEGPPDVIFELESVEVIPEPATASLLALGAMALAWRRRRVQSSGLNGVIGL